MNLVSPICKGCGQPIWGQYLCVLGASWHPEHFLCTACGQPIGEVQFQVHQDMPYHIACYANQIAPRCAYCGKPLVGEYLVNYWGQKFCQEHQEHYQSCKYCKRLLAPADVEPHAEVIRCQVCRSTAIETATEARPLFSRVNRWLNSQGLLYNNLHLSLELCDREHLTALSQGRYEIHALGITTGTTYTENGRFMRTNVDGVAILQGLPSLLFQGIVAHELGHVWLFVQGVHNLPPWAAEGFCDLLSYRYYGEQQGTLEGKFYQENIAQNPDSVYGDGFRRLQAIADSIGFSRLLETLRTTKRLPSSR